jgi:transposase
MTMLAEAVDVVIGVDTHKHTHTAAVIVASTGAAVDELTVGTNLDGYAALVALADEHSGLRAWSIEGTSSYGAGLARFLAERGELVIELDRPHRSTRRNGAKSDPLDAIRAGREALTREHLAQPRAPGQRTALAVRLAARRSAIDAATTAQRQVLALIVAAPEQLRSQFRGLASTTVITRAARLRLKASWDLETQTTAETLRALSRRCEAMRAEATDHETAILSIIKAWRPDLLDTFGIGPIVAAVVLCAWSHPGRCRNEAAFANPPAPHRSPPAPGSPPATDSTEAETANSTAPCTPSPSTACATTPPPAPTSNAAAPKATPTARSDAASSATSPASSTDNSNEPLDDP